jgi:hypothetical protein
VPILVEHQNGRDTHVLHGQNMGIQTLDTGTKVQVVETGTTETIGGITAPWVKVLSENGFTGWAFSGYLEMLNQKQESEETQNPEAADPDLANGNPPNPEQENVETQNPETPKQESGFPVLPFVIAGSAILVSGIVAIAILAKRKREK